MPSIYCKIDDKHVPLYRIMWISELPHFCGKDSCPFEGRYEIRLEQQDSLFASREERDHCLQALQAWRGEDTWG